MKTERLYYDDAYLTAFSARVTDRSADGTRVYLDRTAFYPTSGGQPHDLGLVSGVRVLDVVDEDDRIAHVLAEPLRSTDVADGVIDWARRFDHMQQHTGQHLLSAVFETLFACGTLSVHFGDDHSTLDLGAESLSREQLVLAEERANEIVTENRPVTIAYEDAASAAGLRKASAREGTLRVVSIADLDRSACGGTHVRSTGEIGSVVLRSTERVRKSTRVEFLCGTRAVRRARRDFEALTRIANAFSVALDDAPAAVVAQAERTRELEGARKKLEKQLAEHRARALYAAAAVGSNGVRTIVLRDFGETMDDLRMLALALASMPKVVTLGRIASPASVLLATSEDSGVDAGRVLGEALSLVGGKGGGSPRIAQGSVPDMNAAEAVVSRISAG
ncbi:MAG TPA: DHHA1 domain-containing protein [Gemmatimonadaceae bacterium]